MICEFLKEIKLKALMRLVYNLFMGTKISFEKRKIRLRRIQVNKQKEFKEKKVIMIFLC